MEGKDNKVLESTENNSLFELSSSFLALFNLDLMDYPFLMPNLLGALLALIVCVIGYLFLPETRVFQQSSSESTMTRRGYMSVTQEQVEDSLPTTLQGMHFEMQRSTLRKYCCPCETMWQLMLQREKRLAVLIYAFYSFIHIFYLELAPLWFQASRDRKGFELTSQEVGTILSLASIGLFLWVSCIFPRFSGLLKATELFSSSIILFGVFFIMVPILSELNFLLVPAALADFVDRNKMIVLVCAQLMQNCIQSTAFVAVNALVNNSAMPYERGSLNGLNMMLGSLAKAAGPFLGAELFAWSINTGNKFPIDYHISFYFLAFCCCCLFCYAKQVPSHMNYQQ